MLINVSKINGANKNKNKMNCKKGGFGKMKKKYEKPKVEIKKFEINEFIASGSGVQGNSIFLGGYEYRY
mgnify:CR=1 FL=1